MQYKWFKNNNINELKTVLYNKCLGIVLITETHFTKHQFIDISDYKLLKTNHLDDPDSAHGGVVILIKSSIILHSLSNFCQNYL